MLLLGLVVLAAGGCGRREGAAGTGGAPAPNVVTREVFFPTRDGWEIHADYGRVADAKRAVILLHQRGGSAVDWRPLVEKLNAAGITTLAVDQRGAGRSLGKPSGPDAPWDTTNDIEGAVQWLTQNGYPAGGIGLVGASYGANNALLYAAAHPKVRAVALLSPGADYHGLKIEQAAKDYRGALLVLTATGDTITGGGPELIARILPGAQPKTYDGDAHGTDLLYVYSDALDVLTEFFKTKL